MSDMVTMSKRRLPRLDFSQFLKGDERTRERFCQELVSCMKDYGFVKLLNHGISEEKVEEAFEWVRQIGNAMFGNNTSKTDQAQNARFYALAYEAKMVAAHPPEANPHRGYSYVGQEKLSKVKDYEKGIREAPVIHDIKESFDQGASDDPLFTNRWPDEAALPGFRTFMESLYESFHAVHQNLLQALAIGLNLEPPFFAKMCVPNTAELRLNHYPACDASALRQGTNRISEHTDFGTVTLLFQDSVGGLEVEDQSNMGTYFPVPCEHRAEMIVNIGDLLQRWTNAKLRSTSHRVKLPPGAGDGRINDRYSIAYFGKPNRAQTADTLPEFVAEGERSKYDEKKMALDYMQDKLVMTY